MKFEQGKCKRSNDLTRAVIFTRTDIDGVSLGKIKVFELYFTEYKYI